MTTKTKLSKKKQEAALALVATWIGKFLGYDGPAPTGKDAAWRGEGPMLMPDFTGWYGPARPAILLEGIGGEWAYFVTSDPDVKAGLDKLGIYAETTAGYALSLYPA